MNRLKFLRNNAGISLREMRKYTGISNPVISYLENGKRPFKQEHIDKLSSFFNVTSDYLLGRTDYGFIVRPEFGDEELILTENEYLRLQTFIQTSIIKLSDKTTTLAVETSVEEINVVIPTYVVYRELKGNISNYDLQDTLNAKLTELSKHMTTDELERTIKFIEDYILKK